VTIQNCQIVGIFIRTQRDSIIFTSMNVWRVKFVTLEKVTVSVALIRNFRL